MEIVKAYKYRLKPNKAQMVFFNNTIGCARKIYNAMLEDRIKAYQEDGRTIKPTTGKYTKEFEYMREVDSAALCYSQINLNKAYTNFFKKVKQGKEKPGFPKHKSKRKSKLSYSTICKTTIRIEGNKIKLPKIGFVNMVYHRPIPEGATIGTCTIEKTRTGKYFISICFKHELEVVEVKTVTTATGLDYSSPSMYVDETGKSPEYPKYFREYEDRLAFLQKRMCRRKPGSARREKAKQEVAKLHEKIKNCRLNFIHNESRRLVSKNDLIVVEDLNMQNMARSLNLGKSTNDNGWGMFVTAMEYKLKELGKHLIKIDKWFPSSRMCGSCGKLNRELTLKDRKWTCECGMEHDRDVNAANNILREGIETATTAGIVRVNLRQ